MTDWWKLFCRDCGRDTELLTSYSRVVFCRPCLQKWEDFNEAENELVADVSESYPAEKEVLPNETVAIRDPVDEYRHPGSCEQKASYEDIKDEE